MERAIEVLAIIHFTILGLSHIVQPRAWVEFFTLLREKGVAGNFINAFLSLGIGSLVVAFHNVWTGIPVILTVFGWLSVFKAGLYFLVPAAGVKSLENVTPERANRFAIPGVVLLVVAGLLGYSLATA